MRTEQAAAATRQRAVDGWLEEFGSEQYASRTVAALSGSQRAFLAAVVEEFRRRSTSLYWEEIGRRAGVPRQWTEHHLNRLLTVRLLFDDGEGVCLHPALESGEVSPLT